MTRSDVLAWLDAEIGSFSALISGNVVNATMARRIRPLIESDRTAVIEALRELMGLRVPDETRTRQDSISEARLWLALEIAASNGLVELREDVRGLIADVRSRKTFLPYYERMLAEYESRLT